MSTASTANEFIATPTATPDEVVRLLYRAFEVRDLGRVGDLLTADTVWTDTDVSDSAVGREAVLAALAEHVHGPGGSFALRLQQLYSDAAGRVVAFQEVTSADGRLSSQCVVFDVADGRVARVQGLAPAPSGPVNRY